MNSKQLDRICEMEQRLDLIEKIVTNLSEALDRYTEVQDAIESLDTYYSSDEWRKDFEDDAAGKLPKELKRGVLSEDAVWNLLTEVGELNKRLETFAKTANNK